MNLYTIYRSPKDHPGKWPVRRFELEKPKELLGAPDSLEEARRLVPQGLFNLGRMEEDDPCIYEVWI